MQVTQTNLPGVLVIEPRVHMDDRGFFLESYNRADFLAATGVDVEFTQDNHSRSVKGVVRGLHYMVQKPQGKLIRVLTGTIWDVAVDIRQSSSTFARWVGLEMDGDSRRQLWVPPGYAHGFVALTDAEVLYKVTTRYEAALDRTLRWDDPEIGIEWPLVDPPLLSPKDREAPLLSDAELFA